MQAKEADKPVAAEPKKPAPLVQIKEVTEAVARAVVSATSTAAERLETEADKIVKKPKVAKTTQAPMGQTATAVEAAPQATQAKTEPIFQVQQHHKRLTPNADGKLLSVDTPTLNKFLDPKNDLGPTFVKYFAPWCGHCKTLAPIWKQLAGSLKGKANVVEFDCDDAKNKPRCRQEKITGYPTLVFYSAGESAVYHGGRSLKAMEAYASKAALA